MHPALTAPDAKSENLIKAPKDKLYDLATDYVHSRNLILSNSRAQDSHEEATGTPECPAQQHQQDHGLAPAGAKVTDHHFEDEREEEPSCQGED